MPIRPRIINRPIGSAQLPKRTVGPVAVSHRWIHQSSECPFPLDLPIGWKRKVLIFPPGKLSKRPLSRRDAYQAGRDQYAKQSDALSKHSYWTREKPLGDAHL